MGKLCTLVSKVSLFPFSRVRSLKDWAALPDMSFCKGKAATLFAKSLFSKTGPSGLLIFAKFLFAKVFFQRILRGKWQSMAAERNYRLKNVLVYSCICIY